jgi:hypothetical protein
MRLLVSLDKKENKLITTNVAERDSKIIFRTSKAGKEMIPDDVWEDEEDEVQEILI